MRAFFWAAVLALLPVAAGAATASAAAHAPRQGARHQRVAPAPLTIRVTTGYGEQYRASAWVPVRITVHNRTVGTISGTVAVPDKSATNQGGPSALYHTMYGTALVLPAGATKRVTLYLPGYDDFSSVRASFQPDDHTIKTVSATDYPSTFPDGAFTVGTLTSDRQSGTWLNSNLTVTTAALTPATLDPVPEALSNFDLIALTNVDASQLRQDQKTALEGYVRNGGALLLIGGPSWQETLRSLPPALVPGTLTGSRAVPNLAGLGAVTGSSPPAATIVSVLAHPRGAVRAAQGGVPLVVQRPLGKGEIVYLAFDPALDPVARWKDRGALVTALVGWAAPRAAARANLPGYYNKFMPMQFCCGPVDLSTEVSNVPAAALPSLILFVVLTVFYVLLLGPLNFLVLRRLRRREWSWITIPALAALCMAGTFGVALSARGNTVLVNTVGTVSLQGNHGPYAATVYAGLFAPLRGDYHLSYDRPALPAVLAQPYFYNGPGSPIGNGVTLRFTEGAQTRVDFLSMNMWSMREVALHTSVNVSGRLQSHLTLDGSGHLVGTIRNETNLPLIRPVMLAGNAVAHLPDLPPGRTVRVRLTPAGSTAYRGLLWLKLYGQPAPQQFAGGPMYYPGQGIGANVPFLGSGSVCCPGPLPPQENSLADRIRDVAAALPEMQIGVMPGEVTFLAWTQHSFGTVTVDGTSPQRRDLSLVMAPLSVRLSPGAFTLPTGVLGAHLVSASPGAPGNGCCPFDPRLQPVYVGMGGSAIFQFTFPRSRLHLQRLALDVNAGGAAGDNLGQVFDWGTGRWDGVNLSTGQAQLRAPDRYVSAHGALLVRLQPTADSGAVIIGDAQRQLQISGAGVVS